MPQAKQAAVEFALHWQSADAQHTDRLFFEKVNFWRDFFPGSLDEALAPLAADELVEPWNAGAVHTVRPAQIQLQLRTGEPLVPRAGRFYPRGMVAGLPHVFKGDRRPLRYLGETDGMARVDLNHPLARFPLRVEGRMVRELGVTAEHGGRAHDVAHDLTDAGPGMQAPHPEAATDFDSEEPFALTFSERWFPPKVIRLWPAIHPFERVGLVLEYFRRAGGYAQLASETARGWPRPEDDPYAKQFPYADPLYAVWGRAA